VEIAGGGGSGSSRLEKVEKRSLKKDTALGVQKRKEKAKKETQLKTKNVIDHTLRLSEREKTERQVLIKGKNHPVDTSSKLVHACKRGKSRFPPRGAVQRDGRDR